MLDLSELLKELQDSTLRAVQERAKTEALFASMGEGAIATDENGVIYRINKTALNILGLTEKQALGKWFPDVVMAVTHENKTIPLIDRPITRAFLSGRTISERIYYRTKKNPRLPVFATVSPILQEGKPIGAIETFRDITQEHKVDRMKSEFISIASHQLRTPLSAINTYSRMLYDGYAGDLSGAQRDFMKVILSSIDRMNELITTFLDISRIETGQLQINSSSIDYNEIISTISHEFAQVAAAKKISLRTDLPRAPLQVTADPLLLTEVFSNLLSNAIKYTPQKGTVQVTLAKRNKNILLKISDTGYGIPKESQAGVFSKFFRASNIMQKETFGTGLGLYMVKLIATGMGGKVWFVSRENVGSTFYFSIPVSNNNDGLPAQMDEFLQQQ